MTGKDPIIIKLEENLNEITACNKETELIKEIGRIDLGTGPLTNLTDGGEGSFERNVSIETRKRISESCRGRRAWNKDLTAKTDNRVKQYALKRVGKSKHWTSELVRSQFIKKRSEWCKKNFVGKDNPSWKEDLNEKQLILDFQKGLTYAELRQKYNISFGTIVRRLKNNKIPLKHSLVSDGILAEEYKTGKGFRYLQQKYNISQNRITRSLINQNCKIRPRGSHAT